MNNELIISVYGSHNAAITMYYKGQYHVVEIERWLDCKNIGLTTYMACRNPQLVFDEVCQWLLNKTDRKDVDVLMFDYVQNIKPKFEYKNLIAFDHHTAHAACTFYQSPYNKAIVFTFDGGGDSGYFNVYKIDGRHDELQLLEKFNQDLGFPYMIIADYLDDIKKESLSIGNLVYAGKLMGLCSYGNVRTEWIKYFDEFYTKFDYIGNSYIGGAEARYKAITQLMNQIGIEDFDFENTRISGQLAWDIAATHQKSFENQFYKFARKYLDIYPDYPICLAGGCALNVLLNSKLLNEREAGVFVPPNTNDCGISAGGVLWYLKPESQVDLTYSGIPLMDEHMFSTYMEDRAFSFKKMSIKELAKFINDGHIVGIIQGNSEHGSRALGNRSIVCNPAIADMKDVLNEKVKHREWYRPFAPMVKLEDTQKYFDFPKGQQSRHMTFVATVKQEWMGKLPSITHEDGTGRLQTLTRNQNSLIYDLITEFEKFSGHGVLLNTSFNDNGKPILSRIETALKILNQSQLDAVYYNGNLVYKTTDERKMKSYEEDFYNPLLKPSDESTIHLFAFAENIDEMKNRYFAKIDKILNRETGKPISIMYGHEYHDAVHEKYASIDNVKLYEISISQYYYKHYINTDMIPGFIETTYNYSKFIRHLWMKEAIRDNVHFTKFHMFVDLDYIINKELSIKAIDAYYEFSKNVNDVMITSGPLRSKIFTAEFFKDKYKEVPEKQPIPALIMGDGENIDWLSTLYEGMLLWHLPQEKIGIGEDYLASALYENAFKIKLIELI